MSMCAKQENYAQADRWLMSLETQSQARPEYSDFPVLSIDEVVAEKYLDYLPRSPIAMCRASFHQIK